MLLVGHSVQTVPESIFVAGYRVQTTGFASTETTTASRAATAGAAAARASTAAAGTATGSRRDWGIWLSRGCAAGALKSKGILQSVDQGEFALVAESSSEIIQVNGPNHGTSKVVLLQPFSLQVKALDVVITKPLIALVSIRDILRSIPSLSGSILQESANLIVGPESGLSCVRSCRPSPRCGSTNGSVGWVGENEGVSISWESNNELFSRGTIVLPIVHGIVNIEVDVASSVSGTSIQRAVLTSVSLPGTMEVIGHHMEIV